MKAQKSKTEAPEKFGEAGVAYIPSDRYRSGVATEGIGLGKSCGRGILPGTLFKKVFHLYGKAINESSDELIERFQVSTPGLNVQTGNLSGGNIQRLIAGRELGSNKCQGCHCFTANAWN